MAASAPRSSAPRSIAIVKTSYTRSASEAKASVRYIEQRKGDLEKHPHRQLFGPLGELSRTQAYDRLDRAGEESGKTYFYRIVLNAGEGHADLDEGERRAWTAGVMERIEAQGVKVRDWVAVSHTDQGQHDHVHVVAALGRTLQKDELADLRTHSREVYSGQKEMQHELGVYRDDPRALDELRKYHDLQHSPPQVEHQRQRSLDFDY